MFINSNEFKIRQVILRANKKLDEASTHQEIKKANAYSKKLISKLDRYNKAYNSILELDLIDNP
jgi:hypothetical protein